MKYTWTAILCFSFISLYAENKIKLSVNSGDFQRKDCVVTADLSQLQLSDNSGVVMKETTNGVSKKVNCQIIREEGESPKLYWILNGITPAGSTREFVVEKTAKDSKRGKMKVEDTQLALVIKKNGDEVMQYNYTITMPPKGVDIAYMRSGYIHPAYSPSGNILTTIQPKDHYHHYGIWNPWTRLEYDGKIYDLWNLKDRKGTVRANKINTIYEGKVCAGYNASLEHIIFTPKGEKKIMDETWNVKTWNTPEGFLWDFESGLNPNTSLPVIIKEYRYAGFGWRATEEWTKDNCEMLTSEGKTRKDIDGTTGRWICLTGECENNGKSGMLFMSHPENYNHPEPLRIWNEQANGGRGDAFVNFAPTKNKDWNLEAGKKYKLKYRVYAYDGEMTADEANRLWNDFAYPPVVTVEVEK